MPDKYKVNPFTGDLDIASFFVGASGTAPTSGSAGYMTVVDGVLWYFAGGNRYKIIATLDNPTSSPAVANPFISISGVADGAMIIY